MGCFVTCFCSSKHRNRKSSGAIIPSQHHTQEAAPLAESAKIDEIGKPLSPISNSIEIVDEHQKPNCCGKKKVKFDLIEKLPTNNVAEKLRNESEKKEESPSESDLVASTKLPYPLTHIASESDFDCDSIKNDERKDVGDSAHWQASFVHEESSESLFSLSIDSRKQVYGGEAGDKEVNSPMPVAVCDSPEKKLGSKPLGGMSNHVESVLTPLENLTQLKSTKTRIASSKHADKENVGLERNCGTMAVSTNFEKKMSAGQDFAVDTSLSNWLVSSKTSSKSASEMIASGESDEMIMGTVGSYWSHTGQSLDSDSRSCCKVTSEESEAVANVSSQ